MVSLKLRCTVYVPTLHFLVLQYFLRQPCNHEQQQFHDSVSSRGLSQPTILVSLQVYHCTVTN